MNYNFGGEQRIRTGRVFLEIEPPKPNVTAI